MVFLKQDIHIPDCEIEVDIGVHCEICGKALSAEIIGANTRGMNNPSIVVRPCVTCISRAITELSENIERVVK